MLRNDTFLRLFTPPPCRPAAVVIRDAWALGRQLVRGILRHYVGTVRIDTRPSKCSCTTTL